MTSATVHTIARNKRCIVRRREKISPRGICVSNHLSPGDSGNRRHHSLKRIRSRNRLASPQPQAHSLIFTVLLRSLLHPSVSAQNIVQATPFILCSHHQSNPRPTKTKIHSHSHLHPSISSFLINCIVPPSHAQESSSFSHYTNTQHLHLHFAKCLRSTLPSTPSTLPSLPLTALQTSPTLSHNAPRSTVLATGISRPLSSAACSSFPRP